MQNQQVRFVIGVQIHVGHKKNTPNALIFIQELEDIITNRKENPTDKSYTTSLLAKGINKVAQKVGEEAVEMVIEAKDTNDEPFLNEPADLLYHYLILLHAKGFKLKDVTKILKERQKIKKALFLTK